MTEALRVLIVEDDRPMAQMCAKLVRRHGHSVHLAESCEDALALVKASPDVDVVLTDIQMPHTTGTELLARLRDFNPNLPVIVMTGCANAFTASQALALGAVDYLTKPFDAEALIKALGRVLHPQNA